MSQPRCERCMAMVYRSLRRKTPTQLQQAMPRISKRHAQAQDRRESPCRQLSPSELKQDHNQGRRRQPDQRRKFVARSFRLRDFHPPTRISNPSANCTIASPRPRLAPPAASCIPNSPLRPERKPLLRRRQRPHQPACTFTPTPTSPLHAVDQPCGAKKTLARSCGILIRKIGFVERFMTVQE